MADLTTLDPKAVAANLAKAWTQVLELHPTLDPKRGPVHDLVVYPHAVLATALQADLAGYLAARSLLAVTLDPAPADAAAVDAILSNFRVTRRPAGAASGRVVVVTSGDTTAVVAAGAAFYANGRTYATTRVFVAKAEPEQVVGPGDRLITPLAGGGYAFTVDVVAAAAGSDSTVTRDTAFLPASPPPGFLRAYAAGDFTGGADAETNAELLARLSEGLAARGPSSRVSMAAMLREFLPTYQALSVVGYGDPEMLRDRHGVLPVSCGGRVDWYVRTSAAAPRVPLPVTATLVRVEPSGNGLWQFTLSRDDAPGFYEVRGVLPAGADPASVAGGYPVVSDERSVDLSGAGFVPDVETVTEGAYSRYQSAVLRFLAPAGGAAAGATAAFTADAVVLPGLADVQAYVSSTRNRCYGADCLVRAPVPCFVEVSLTANVAAGGLAPDAAGASAAVARAVNSAGFTGRLFASDLLEAARPFLNGGGVSAFDMLGRVRYPDGRNVFLRAADVLAAPDDPAACVSFRTVAFFCDADSVSVSVVASVPSA